MDPESISFVSAIEGWALGPGTCRNCARIWHTTDAGQHWSSMTSTLHLPGSDESAAQGGLVTVDFLNERDGYLFYLSACSSDCALITTDGGRTWRPSGLAHISAVANGAHSVYALTGDSTHVALLRIGIGASHWTRLSLPRPHSKDVYDFTLAADRDTFAVLQAGSDLQSPLRDAHDIATAAGALWISPTQGAEFTRAIDPCHDTDGGAADVSIALDHPDALLLDCYNGKQSSQEQVTQNHLYGSDNDGRTWTRLADPTQTGSPRTIADNGQGHAFFVSDGGDGYELRVSLDGAAHWHTVLHAGEGGFDLDGPIFINADVGFALGPIADPPEHLYRTTDAGRTWHQLPLMSA